MNKKNIIKIRDDILDAAFIRAGKEGWSWKLIEKAADEAGYSAAKVRAVFPSGLADALDHFSDMADTAMKLKFETIHAGRMRTHERVRTALIARYEWLAPRKEAFKAALAFWAQPRHKPRAARIVWRTADRIWDLAGDEARDYNRYTKRALLAGIIVSSTLVWINEDEKNKRGENLSGLKAFIDRRMANVMQLNKGLSFLKGFITIKT